MNKNYPSNSILGVDPGTSITGYAIISSDSAPKLIVAGVIDLRKIKDQHEKLRTIFSGLYQIITKYEPEHLSIEAPFYGKNIQSMLKLGRAQGVALTSGMLKGLKTKEYAPRKIKQSVTGNGNSSKQQVAKMLNHLLNDDFSKLTLDATDAIAIAYCHYIHLSSSTSISGNKYSGWGDYIKNNPNKTT